MRDSQAANIHSLEFSCKAPLKFFENCSSCARFGDVCPDLQLGKELLKRRKKLLYGKDQTEDGIHVSAFNCLTPLKYFEKTRSKCAHKGRCRDEGLLMALLSGKRSLDYSQRAAVDLKIPKRKQRTQKVSEAAPKKLAR